MIRSDFKIGETLLITNARKAGCTGTTSKIHISFRSALPTCVTFKIINPRDSVSQITKYIKNLKRV